MLGFCEICMQLTLSVLSLPMLEQNAVKEKIRCWPVKWKTWFKHHECLSAKPNSLFTKSVPPLIGPGVLGRNAMDLHPVKKVFQKS